MGRKKLWKEETKREKKRVWERPREYRRDIDVRVKEWESTSGQGKKKERKKVSMTRVISSRVHATPLPSCLCPTYYLRW